ncbi:hypothetical protein Syun_027523 [Stephania yunnanensis]|uniref:RRM domain-containing protein n=1 Tax=Stephania yunnanensis TaxID=152371 RepID=A0AAP0EKV1_9MAGN
MDSYIDDADVGGYDPTPYREMLHNVAGPSFNWNAVDESPNPQARQLYDMIDESREQLWPGCETMITLSAMARLKWYQIQTLASHLEPNNSYACNQLRYTEDKWTMNVPAVDGGLLKPDVVEGTDDEEGKSIGYALLEFKTHSDAMSAFQWLKQRDALFGRDRSAKVKTVYLEGLAESWEEDKLKKLCEQDGEDEKVQSVRKFLSTRRKDFGFVSFVTRESASSLCRRDQQSFEIGEGDNKVIISIVTD